MIKSNKAHSNRLVEIQRTLREKREREAQEKWSRVKTNISYSGFCINVVQTHDQMLVVFSGKAYEQK